MTVRTRLIRARWTVVRPRAPRWSDRGDDVDPRPLHALVNNAGIHVNAPVEALPMAQWRWVFEINLSGHIAVTQVGGKMAMDFAPA